jgi:hypothetical protein
MPRFMVMKERRERAACNQRSTDYDFSLMYHPWLRLISARNE